MTNIIPNELSVIDLDGRPFGHQQIRQSSRCSFGKVHERFTLNATLHFEIKNGQKCGFLLTELHSNVASEVCHSEKPFSTYASNHLSVGHRHHLPMQHAVSLPSVSISHAVHICRCANRRLAVTCIRAAEHDEKSSTDCSQEPGAHFRPAVLARRGAGELTATKLQTYSLFAYFTHLYSSGKRERVISNVNT